MHTQVLDISQAKVIHLADLVVVSVAAESSRWMILPPQPDNTGGHPAFALQWSLQGAHALQDAVDAVHANDATVAVVGGGTSLTSGEGDDRASLGLPGTQLEFLQTVHAAALTAKKPFAVRALHLTFLSRPHPLLH